MDIHVHVWHREVVSHALSFLLVLFTTHYFSRVDEFHHSTGSSPLGTLKSRIGLGHPPGTCPPIGTPRKKRRGELVINGPFRSLPVSAPMPAPWRKLSYMYFHKGQ